MDQSSLTGPPEKGEIAETPALPFFPAAIAGELDDGPLVVIVRTPLEFCHWLRHAPSSVQWIQAEGLLNEPEVWATAARKEGDVALDVVVSDPANDFARLYRLVDVRNVRDVRVTIPVVPGFTKALRLAASIQLPVRLLPGQPDTALIEELLNAVQFYLHDPMVEAPVDFFHSCLAMMQGTATGDLWMILEQDPNEFPHHDESGDLILPEGVEAPISSDFVSDHIASLSSADAECNSCAWKEVCRGYFKLPDPTYSCEGIVSVFDSLKNAADQMTADLSAMGATIQGKERPNSNS